MESGHHRQQQLDASQRSLASEDPVQSADDAATTTGTASLTTCHEELRYSSDPFAPNYRHIYPLSAEEKAYHIATWPLPLRPDFWEVFESTEHAEYTRPFDQLDILLRQRRLKDEYWRVLRDPTVRDFDVEAKGDDAENEKENDRLRKFLRDAGAADLLEKANETFWLGRVRAQVIRGGARLDTLLEAGDMAGYMWIQMRPEMIQPTKDDTTGGN
ncbi:hypothetical protein P171DRAFT_430262 [Karstenula rhodostoma CBS 690.94]|uniref:Uncharacterized protein n=1 Tax=Karstenula rhodostoma CBS 690.94 TaxID=1392251 RepID=A0A9P4PLL9_9PLEO|nr:hypothetical protein P171DRAFT_430262 [Karstenula rhodostoma CBS 690.94]